MNKAVSSPSRARAQSDPGALTLAWLLEEMVGADLISSAAARQVSEPPRRKDGSQQHPLVVAAAQDWPDRRVEGRKLSVEALTQWLAHRVRLPYVRIDPLKLDVATMTEVVESIHRVNGIMGEISHASDEQSRGIDQVNQTVSQIDEATQQNAALVEQATAAAQSLQDQAQALKATVAVFRIDTHSDVAKLGDARHAYRQARHDDAVAWQAA